LRHKWDSWQKINRSTRKSIYSQHTHTNPKEHCKSITTRSEKVVGEGIGDNLLEREKNLREKKMSEGEKEKNREKNESEDKKGDKSEKSENQVRSLPCKNVAPLKDIPYPHVPSRKSIERQFIRFMDILKQLQINIPLTEALQQMPTYARFMKELLTKKRKYLEQETVELEAGCSAIIQKSLPQKSRDPRSFTLPVTIGNLTVGKALLDLGASINLIPLSTLKKIGDVEVKPTRMTLQLADRSIKHPYRIVEDMIVKVDKFLFPVDFVVMDMDEDAEVPLILGRPFMKTAKVIIDVDKGQLKVCVQDEEVSFDVFEAMKHSSGAKECFRMDALDEVHNEQKERICASEPLMKALTNNINETKDIEVNNCWEELEKTKEIEKNSDQKQEKLEKEVSQPHKLELKQLPAHLKYVFLAGNGEQPVIMSSSLKTEEEEKVVEVLKANREAIGWTLSDLKGISPSYCMHKIHMEQDFRPVAQPQRRLNPTMKEVAKK